MTPLERTPFGEDSVAVTGPGYDAVHYGPKDAVSKAAHIVAEIGRLQQEARDAAARELAARLYWYLDRAAPGLDEPTSWEELSLQERNVYILAVEDLARYGDLWDILVEPPLEEG